MNDNCDRCGATGQVYVVLPSGLDLVFCGHHGREYESKLLDIAAEVSYDDDSHRLLPQPA